MKRKIIMTFTLLFAVVAVILAQDDTIKDALIQLGISPALAVVISVGLAFVIGNFAIPNKWAAPFLWVEKILHFLYLAFHKVNEATNVESKKQKAARLAKKAGIVVMLLGLGGMAMAQGSSYITKTGSFKEQATGMRSLQAEIPEPGFFEPLDKYAKDRRYGTRAAGDKSKIMLFRPAVTAQGLFIAFGEKNPETTAFNGVGLGGSYGMYTEKSDGTLYCTFGVQANFWTQFQAGETVDTKMGLSVQGEFVNRFFNIGPAVYFDQGKPKFGIVYGLSYRF